MLQIALWALLIVSLVTIVQELHDDPSIRVARKLVIPMIGVVIALIHLV